MGKTIELAGESEQVGILVGAIRYAWGRDSYIAKSICATIGAHIEDIDPYVAFYMARDIRNCWCHSYDNGLMGNEDPKSGETYRRKVQPFVDLLPELDKASYQALRDDEDAMDVWHIPFGYLTWEEVPEEVRFEWPEN